MKNALLSLVSSHAESPQAAVLASACFGGVAVVCASLAGAAQDGVSADLQSELDALRRDVAVLRANGIGGGNWLTEARTEEVRAIVTDVLADAATRTSLQESVATSGWKDGFFLNSADGAYSMRFNGYIQTRYTFDSRESVAGLTGTQDLEAHGFETRRIKMVLEGNVVDSSWTYKVETALSSGTTSLDDTWVEKRLAEGLTMKIGQFKAPFMREFLLSDPVAMMVDRSSVEGFFTPGRAQGVQLNWREGDVQLTGAYLNGFAVKSNYFTSGDMRNLSWGSTAIADYAVVARAEWKLAGEWAQFKDPAGWASDGFGVLLGVAGEAERKDNNQGVPAAYGAIEPSVIGGTVDLSVEFSGASILTYGVWRQVDPNDAALATSDQFCFMIQGGLFVTDTVELVARYEYGDADTSPNGDPLVLNTINNNGYSTLNTVGVGVNWFIQKQRIKLTTDLCYAMDGIGAFTNSGNGFLSDGTGAGGAFDQDGQIIARMQFQMMW